MDSILKHLGVGVDYGIVSKRMNVTLQIHLAHYQALKNVLAALEREYERRSSENKEREIRSFRVEITRVMKIFLKKA